MNTVYRPMDRKFDMMELLTGPFPDDFRSTAAELFPESAMNGGAWNEDSPPPASSTESPRGGFDADFSPAPEPKYVCPICMLVLRDPMQTNCGHRFCRLCIFQWLSHSSLCPSCKTSVRQNEIFPDNYAKREILGFTVLCPNKGNGCDVIVELRAIEDHIKSCREMQQLCKICSKTIANSEMEKHIKESCLSVVIPCKFQPFGCNERCERQHMAMHMLRSLPDHLEMLATYVLGTDRRSDSNLTSLLQTFTLTESDLDEILGHRTAPNSHKLCAKSAPDCSFARDKITDEFVQSRGKRWLKECQRLHTCNVSSNAKCSAGKQDDADLNKLAVSLERTVKEQAKKLDEYSECIKRLENTIHSLGTRSSHGVFIWKITDFSRRFQEAKANKNSILYSPGFYSSYYGYKTCLRVHLNGTGSALGKYLSLFIHFMPGEYDAVLQWPFYGRISLSILDQNSDFKLRSDISENMEPSSNLEAFEKPKESRNHKGFGYLEFVPLSTLHNASYVKCDTLYIKAFVDSPVL